MVKKGVAIMSLLVMCLSVSKAKKLDFIDIDFNEFVRRVVVDEKDREIFKRYYSILSQKLRDSNEQKKEGTYSYLYDLALSNLKTKNPDWYRSIEPFVTDPRYTLNAKFDSVRKMIRFFLTRYGAYQEYVHIKNKRIEKEESIVLTQHNVKAESGFWDNIKTKFSHATTKVSHWFGFSKVKVDTTA